MKKKQVVVYVAPIITNGPEDRHVKNGERISLYCSASGFPTPTIAWRYQNTLISGGRISLTSFPGESL